MSNDAHDFVHTFFKKGAEFTEELLKDNEQLRQRALDLESENASLRTQLAGDEAMRDLMRTIGELEKEKNELLSRIHAAGAVSTRFSSRFAEVEEELSQLANLYIASYQLHSSLDGVRVVKHLRELLAQLVGASSFAIYWYDPSKKALVPLVCEGRHPTTEIAVGTDAEHPATDPRLARLAYASERAFLTGVATIHDGPLAEANAPVACVPLRLEDRPLGLVVVDEVLEQKERFLPVDFELFKMLGGHAATALVGALLFRETSGKLPPLEPLRRDLEAAPPMPNAKQASHVTAPDARNGDDR